MNYKGKPRLIGYAWPAVCDHPGCKKKIDRGLAYACGGMHGEMGGVACNGYFCEKHCWHIVPAEGENPFADVDSLKVKTVGVCNECYKHHQKYVKDNKPKRRKNVKRPKK